MWDFMENCCDFEPSKRPDARDVAAWLRQLVDIRVLPQGIKPSQNPSIFQLQAERLASVSSLKINAKPSLDVFPLSTTEIEEEKLFGRTFTRDD